MVARVLRRLLVAKVYRKISFYSVIPEKIIGFKKGGYGPWI